jgi:hypothetical protein
MAGHRRRYALIAASCCLVVACVLAIPRSQGHTSPAVGTAPAAGLALPGSGAGTQSPSTAVPLPQTSLASGGAGGRDAEAPLPLDRLLSAMSDPLIDQAMRQLVSDCLSRRGLPIPQEPTTGVTPVQDADRPLAELPYGLVDSARAAHWGYRDPPEERSRASRIAATRASAASGPPPAAVDACTTQAATTLGPDPNEEDVELLFRLRDQVHDHTGTDRRVAAAADRWKACMAHLGYDYDTPLDAVSAAWPETLDQRERATAVADVGCKSSTGWVPAWRYAQRERQEEALLAHRTQVDRLSAALARRSARAVAALGGGGATSAPPQASEEGYNVP